MDRGLPRPAVYVRPVYCTRRAYTFGNYPIDTLIGPHFINFDFMAKKQFHITETRFLRSPHGFAELLQPHQPRRPE